MSGESAKRAVTYVRLDPTGNITCLVTGLSREEDRPRITKLLLDRCEQVGYLTAPTDPAARARLQMMGGEFCGNAAMAAAAWLARQDGATACVDIPLEVSGAEGVVQCAVTPVEDGSFAGRVAMPPVREIGSARFGARAFALVRMEGIAHLICEDCPLEKAEAEELLLAAAGEMPDAAIGLMQWDSASGFMRPLVWVRESGTLVWETGCGSGTTAVGAWLAVRKGNGMAQIEVRQPGGLIRAYVEAWENQARSVAIEGRVVIGETGTVYL